MKTKNELKKEGRKKKVLRSTSLVLLFLFLLTSTHLHAVITPAELQTIDSMLQTNGLNINSVNFPKNWGNPAFVIPTMLDILEHPFQYPIFVNTLKEKLQTKDPLQIYDFATETVFLNPLSLEGKEALLATPTEGAWVINTRLANIKKPKDILLYAEHIYTTANTHYQQAFSDLTPQEQRYLEVFIYDITKDDEEDDRYTALSQGVEPPDVDDEMEYLVELIGKIDFAELTTSAKLFFQGMHALANIDLSPITFNSLVTYKSKMGNMAVGTKNADSYTENYTFIYDPAGNDIYSLNMSTNRQNPFFAIIDLQGSDVYRNSQIGGLFTALYGNVLHYDAQGDDYYYGDDLAFSANIGSLISIDLQGNDTYITGAKTLGAATMGIALVVNSGGNDFFSSHRYAQGFGGTLGFGILASFATSTSDNDVYYAGGKYLHAPLAPNDYQSLSQGFGFGLRPDLAGGIGVLFDEAGNDFYNGGVYSQGVAYYYALGILIDLQGNDFYNAVYYPQGSGIHLAAGFLYDEAGDDLYYSKNGPGQGAGHDYGVGFLVDRAGNDSYSVDGGNGMGISNSVGIFIDAEGNDRYERQRKDSYGFGGTAREMGSIGIFLDTGGDDKYPIETTQNDHSWRAGTYGIGQDIGERPVSPASEPPLVASDSDTPPIPAPEIDPNLPIAELFAIAAEWEVGSAVDRVQKARAIMLTREQEATDYVFDKKLKTKSGLELRAIIHLARNSNTFKERLPEGLQHPHRRGVANTIYIISLLQLSEYLDTFETMLNNGQYKNSILSALGSFKTDQAIDLLESHLHDEDIYTRTIVAQSLKEIGTPRAIQLILSLDDHDDFLIKSMKDLINGL